MYLKVRSCKLRAESLESRQMMAGDVDAYAIGRYLYLTGDDASNGVAITNDGSGNLNVVGLNQGGLATTINGSASQSFVKIKDIIVSLGKGDDALAITNVALQGNLYVSGGKGNDAVGLGNFTDTGLFDDAVDALLGTLTVRKSVILNGDDGDDTILADDVAIRASLVISTGLGNDTVQCGDNLGVTAKNATFSTSTGDDLLSLQRVSIAKSLVLSTGLDNDDVTLNQVSAKNLTVSLSNGDDDVSVQDSTTTRTAIFSGGSDTNHYTSLGTNTFKKLIRKGFEGIA